jgi:hypothetical protein
MVSGGLGWRRSEQMPILQIARMLGISRKLTRIALCQRTATPTKLALAGLADDL